MHRMPNSMRLTGDPRTPIRIPMHIPPSPYSRSHETDEHEQTHLTHHHEDSAQHANHCRHSLSQYPISNIRYPALASRSSQQSTVHSPRHTTHTLRSSRHHLPTSTYAARSTLQAQTAPSLNSSSSRSTPEIIYLADETTVRTHPAQADDRQRQQVRQNTRVHDTHPRTVLASALLPGRRTRRPRARARTERTGDGRPDGGAMRVRKGRRSMYKRRQR
ncbi:hypothetical protein L227DRAFT_345756 [Lentinus tigrinus ALCF2SS1-6]|uniref:Uncharacterized protein n=1 Tax=Lentinus tigrinus ALCF2SS1-6 TaxID=1328759 RepID=A0A5C2RSC0_9APHY|nr:hypothetical protein L227DRAFT_345756 [Lentinus tigrinus ALCF2SS1-6]